MGFTLDDPRSAIFPKPETTNERERAPFTLSRHSLPSVQTSATLSLSVYKYISSGREEEIGISIDVCLSIDFSDGATLWGCCLIIFERTILAK